MILLLFRVVSVNNLCLQLVIKTLPKINGEIIQRRSSYFASCFFSVNRTLKTLIDPETRPVQEQQQHQQQQS
jgi:hypothetical protein